MSILIFLLEAIRIYLYSLLYFALVISWGHTPHSRDEKFDIFEKTVKWRGEGASKQTEEAVTAIKTLKTEDILEHTRRA